MPEGDERLLLGDRRRSGGASWSAICGRAVQRHSRALIVAAVVVVIVVATTAGVLASKSSSSSSSQPWTNSRLSGDVWPQAYTLSMSPDVLNSTFTGHVAINATFVVPTTSIVLQSLGLDIGAVRVSHSGQDVQVDSVFLYPENEFLVIQLHQTQPSGVDYVIDIDFAGSLDQPTLAGFYRSSYVNSTGDTVYLATTQFEPTDARRAFPCFDEPSFKAQFFISLTVADNQDYVVLSNMPTKGAVEPLPNSLERWTFEGTPLMSTYLVAFIVCDFGSIETVSSTGIQVRVWAPKDIVQVQGALALNSSAEILSFYEAFFDQPFVLPKMDLIAIPDFAAGAMENWGLVTYRETAVLWDPSEGSSAAKQRVVVVIAHELAHQWFGNLVTMKWWNELWLNEGFASFTEYIGTESVFPSWEMQQQFLLDDYGPALSTDSLNTSHPINMTVSTPNDINGLFDSITYEKGAAMIRMLEGIIGKAVFLTGIRAYIKEYAYSNAQTTQLWASLQKAADDAGVNVNIAETMNSWITRAGYPVLTVTGGADGEVTQERFLLPASAVNPDEGLLWDVYFTYETQRGAPGSFQLTDAQSTVPFADYDVARDGWIKGNVNEASFYRTNYADVGVWQLLADQLLMNMSVFTVADRTGIVSDVFALGRAGDTDMLAALNVSRYLINEVEYVPYITAISGLSYTELMLRVTPSFGLFSSFMKKVLTPLTDSLGFGSGDSLSHTQRLLRADVASVASSFGVPSAVGNCSALFAAFMADPQANPVTPDLRAAVYSTGVRQGGEAAWDFIWSVYETTQVASEQIVALHALGQAVEPWLLNRYLYRSIDGSIRSQDRRTVIDSVAGTAIGEPLAWQFVKTNWDLLVEQSGFAMAGVVGRVTKGFNTLSQQQEVSGFFTGRNLGSMASSIASAVETIGANIVWMKENEAKIDAWLTVNQ